MASVVDEVDVQGLGSLVDDDEIIIAGLPLPDVEAVTSGADVIASGTASVFLAVAVVSDVDVDVEVASIVAGINPTGGGADAESDAEPVLEPESEVIAVVKATRGTVSVCVE